MNSSLTLGTYEHYKGNRYEVIGVGKHTETEEEMVVYKALYSEGQIWIRPLAMFTETIEKEGKVIPRFKFVG